MRTEETSPPAVSLTGQNTHPEGKVQASRKAAARRARPKAPAKPRKAASPPPDPFRALGGSARPAFNQYILREVMAAQWVATPPGPERKAAEARAIAASISALEAFQPKDEIEGMLAAQAVAMHLAAMEAFRRAVRPEQLEDLTSKLWRDGANLSRGMVDMLEALNRKRGKGKQVIRIERVIVQDGGKAVVGNIDGPMTGNPPLMDEGGEPRG